MELLTPGNLDDVLHRLLIHAAEVRVAGPDRDAWVATRLVWLRAARKEHADIGKVPLLATLLTLVAADSTDAPVGQGRARLLLTAVRNSVLRWEQHRPDAAANRSDSPSPGQLLDGFATLGHLLAGSSSPSIADAAAAVATMLDKRWGVTAPGAAGEITGHILRFWDQHDGVFVETDNGIVVPRSRVFTEIASAMAAGWLNDEKLTSWMTATVSDPDRRVALLLAAELEPRVMAVLLTDADEAAASLRAVAAAEAVRHGATVNADQCELLLERLATAAAQGLTSGGDRTTPADLDAEPTVAVGPSGWICAQELARLRLPGQLSSRRRQALDTLPLNAEQRTVAEALVLKQASRA